jgi:hypothetical protein
MTLGNMRGLACIPRSALGSSAARPMCLSHALSHALIGWSEVPSFDFCGGQQSIATRKTQLPFAILLIANFLRALLALLRSCQIFPCFWCHSSSIHSPMDARHKLLS